MNQVLQKLDVYGLLPRYGLRHVEQHYSLKSENDLPYLSVRPC